MSKKGFLVLIILGIFLITGCGQVMNNTNDNDSSVSFTSVTEKMKACAPDLSSSALDNWSTNWSRDGQYSIFTKHFRVESGSESIYGAANLLDIFMDALETAIVEADINGDFNTPYSVTMGTTNYTFQVSGNISDYTGTGVQLPNILGSSNIASISKKAIFDIKENGSNYMKLVIYYGITNDIQTLIIYQNNLSDTSKTIGYANINNTTGVITYKSAGASSTIPSIGASHINNEFRCLINFEGNFIDKTSKFSLKTDAATGWAVLGGGSVASNNSLYAVRALSPADSLEYANDGANLNVNAGHYVIISMSDLNNNTDLSGAGWPKAATALGSESLAEKKFIIINDPDSMGWTDKYPFITDIVLTEI